MRKWKLWAAGAIFALALAGCTNYSGPAITGPHSFDDRPQKCYDIVHQNTDGYVTSVYGHYCRVGR